MSCKFRERKKRIFVSLNTELPIKFIRDSPQQCCNNKKSTEAIIFADVWLQVLIEFLHVERTADSAKKNGKKKERNLHYHEGKISVANTGRDLNWQYSVLPTCRNIHGPNRKGPFSISSPPFLPLPWETMIQSLESRICRFEKGLPRSRQVFRAATLLAVSQISDWLYRSSLSSISKKTFGGPLGKFVDVASVKMIRFLEKKYEAKRESPAVPNRCGK